MWVKLDDDFVDHPKIVTAGPLAGWLFVAGLCYANRWLTDGFIPETQVALLVPHVNGNGENARATTKLAARLCAQRLWKSAERNGVRGYRIHDFLKYQPSKKQVLRERKKTAERVARWRGNHARSNGVTNTAPDPGPDPGTTKNPPNPPSAKGGRLTRRERQDAETIRNRAYGGCPHQPRCSTAAECIREIALSRRAKAASS